MSNETDLDESKFKKKKKQFLCPTLVVALCIFIVTLLIFTTWKCFFDSSIIGTWGVEINSSKSNSDESVITGYTFTFEKGSVCKIHQSGTTFIGRYYLVKNDDDTPQIHIIMSSWGKAAIDDYFDYSIVGNVFTGRTLKLLDRSGFFFTPDDVSQKSSSDTSKTESTSSDKSSENSKSESSVSETETSENSKSESSVSETETSDSSKSESSASESSTAESSLSSEASNEILKKKMQITDSKVIDGYRYYIWDFKPAQIEFKVKYYDNFKADSKLLGSWLYKDDDSGYNYTYTFGADGSFEMMSKEFDTKGSYKVDNGTCTIKYYDITATENETPIKYSVSGKTMTLGNYKFTKTDSKEDYETAE